MEIPSKVAAKTFESKNPPSDDLTLDSSLKIAVIFDIHALDKNTLETVKNALLKKIKDDLIVSTQFKHGAAVDSASWSDDTKRAIYALLSKTRLYCDIGKKIYFFE